MKGTILPRGTVLGLVEHRHLPVEVKEAVNALLSSRRWRTKQGFVAVALFVTASHAALSRHSRFALPLALASSGALAKARQTSREAKSATEKIAMQVHEQRENASFSPFLRRGATHVLIDAKGNVHFVSAPALKGKPFKPVFRRMLAPLKE